jgi:hypothetical protein
VRSLSNLYQRVICFSLSKSSMKAELEELKEM